MRMRLLACVAILAAAACSDSLYGGGGGGCTPTATQVCMNGQAFGPLNLTINAGTAVTWRNGDGIVHTVTSATGSGDVYDSGNIGGGGTFAHTFNTPGTYNYYCKIHGANGTPPTGMRGTITVN
ncbi:MAG TPA: plastocyanin/azurin family copper-binding protein [Gemmatimonadales bacterium]|jgi:plastocyanin|nr:plastocyanin/azurin family copper-binding protein [Gemmatimonadales bacterium]